MYLLSTAFMCVFEPSAFNLSVGLASESEYFPACVCLTSCLHLKVNRTNLSVRVIKGGVCVLLDSEGFSSSLNGGFSLYVGDSLVRWLQRVFDGRERQKLFSVSLVYCLFVIKIRLFFCLFFNLHLRLPLSLYSSRSDLSYSLKQSMLPRAFVCVVWVIYNMFLGKHHAPTIFSNLFLMRGAYKPAVVIKEKL